MVWPTLQERVVDEGVFGRVEYAVRSNGRMDVKKWLLKEADAKIASGFDYYFSQTCHDGRIINTNQFEKIQGVDGIYEFKKGAFRIFCYEHENPDLTKRWILVSVYRKGHLDQTREAEKAREAALAFLEREAGVEAGNDEENEGED